MRRKGELLAELLNAIADVVAGNFPATALFQYTYGSNFTTRLEDVIKKKE